MELFHGGRAVHPYHIGGKETWAPTAEAIKGDVHTPKGKVPHAVPKEMTHEDIKAGIQGYRKAAENAKKAGFDGIEVHACNGFLFENFMKDGGNKRTDEYGGSIENRCRFPL